MSTVTLNGRTLTVEGLQLTVCFNFVVWYEKTYKSPPETEVLYNALPVSAWLLYAIRELCPEWFSWAYLIGEWHLGVSWNSTVHNPKDCDLIREAMPFELFMLSLKSVS